jgi:hypothetical protein
LTLPSLFSLSVLLEASADPCYQNGELDTPLYMAVLSNSLPCVKLISEKVSPLRACEHFARNRWLHSDARVATASCPTRILIAQTWRVSLRCTMLRVRAIFKSPSIWWRRAGVTQNFQTTSGLRPGSARCYRAAKKLRNICCRCECLALVAHFHTKRLQLGP